MRPKNKVKWPGAILFVRYLCDSFKARKNKYGAKSDNALKTLKITLLVPHAVIAHAKSPKTLIYITNYVFSFYII